MCPPDYFDVIDVKNPFMQEQVGKVNRAEAQRQWQELRVVYERLGIRVEILEPLADCEDMVFCDNPAFVGVSRDGRRLCVPSTMKYASRQREVGPLTDWFKNSGYEIQNINPHNLYFEGGGDAIWHPQRALIWGGFGNRSDAEIYPRISNCFDVAVITLELTGNQFYHLDTCFCPLNAETVLVYSPAFTKSGLSLIHRIFRRVIEVKEDEAVNLMACNAAAFLGKYVIIQRGAIRINQRLADLGFQVTEVETSEFMKSGGSVFCMKLAVY
jgi:N-dimethylarginine dimethylaminohydrolase